MRVRTGLVCFAIAMLVGCAGGRDDGDTDSSEGAVSGNTSGYTSLVEGDPSKPWYKECRQVEWATDNVPEFYGRWDCGGQGGYSAFVSGGDGREMMSIRTPRGKVFDLEIYQHAGGFGHFGPNAEWRGSFASPGQVNPSALIVRYIESQWDENYKHETEHHHLLVAKLTNDAACIYADVDGGQTQANEKARVEADRANSVTCPAEEPDEPLKEQYTSIEPQDCRPGAGGALDCGGVAEFAFLQKKEGNGTKVTIRTPDGNVHDIPANFPVVGDVTATTLGPKAEWRGWDFDNGQVYPEAVIYRYKRKSQQHNREHHTLVVVKVNSSNPCVYAIVEASKQSDVANRLAAEIADRSRNDVCPAEMPKFPAMEWSNPDPT